MVSSPAFLPIFDQFNLNSLILISLNFDLTLFKWCAFKQLGIDWGERRCAHSIGNKN